MGYISPGTYKSCCYGLINLGTLKFENEGADDKFTSQIMLLWEIHEELTSKPKRNLDALPPNIAKEYTLSLSNSSSLRSDLESWRGRPFSEDEIRRFDLKTILGGWCNLEISDLKKNDELTLSMFTAILPLKDVQKIKLPKLKREIVFFNIHEPDWDVYKSFDTTIKEKLQKSIDWKKAHNYKDT